MGSVAKSVAIAYHGFSSRGDSVVEFSVKARRGLKWRDCRGDMCPRAHNWSGEFAVSAIPPLHSELLVVELVGRARVYGKCSVRRKLRVANHPV